MPSKISRPLFLFPSLSFPCYFSFSPSISLLLFLSLHFCVFYPPLFPCSLPLLPIFLPLFPKWETQRQRSSVVASIWGSPFFSDSFSLAPLFPFSISAFFLVLLSLALFKMPLYFVRCLQFNSLFFFTRL